MDRTRQPKHSGKQETCRQSPSRIVALGAPGQMEEIASIYVRLITVGGNEDCSPSVPGVRNRTAGIRACVPPPPSLAAPEAQSWLAQRFSGCTKRLFSTCAQSRHSLAAPEAQGWLAQRFSGCTKRLFSTCAQSRHSLAAPEAQGWLAQRFSAGAACTILARSPGGTAHKTLPSLTPSQIPIAIREISRSH